MSDFGTLKTEVQNNLGERDDSNTDAIILANFNKAQNFMAREVDWEELESRVDSAFVIGQTEYTLAELSLSTYRNIYTFMVLDDSQYYEIQYITPVDWDRIVGPNVSGTSGKPTIFTIWNRNIEVYPSPDEAYTVRLRYYSYPVDVVSDTDSPSVTQADAVLVALTTAFCFLTLEQQKMSDTWLSQAVSILSLYKKEEGRIQNMLPVNIGTTGLSGRPWADPFVKSTKLGRY